ncbi:chromatin associated protein KTI12 [Guyanagaster necrorhizus]|uniref:Chromatin associated protein KTI12 n=1 Tax=Guyanagaster necrorhizus TaxID=856835 RepID=A0A9P7VX41_9AGAR|nr:chromatin associated protein KTI12 [Guyanagaster necrorhizus MCA 3950]KAG7448330.1 chromatin associated protein KTI12 [Guyanagaster necrorhizus MCA 3950]
MALITISGYPCSGKSRRAQQIVSFIQGKLKDPEYNGPQYNIVLISDESLNISRSAYDDSRLEKPARGALFTALQRQISLKNIVIVDAPNYIKGFRYQIYCAAREFKVRVCTVYVVATPERCREWNSSRVESERYAPETLENLIQRYEEPSSMVRWDSPLFTILWTDEDIPSVDIWKAITDGVVKPPNSGTLSITKAPTDALITLENTTLSIVFSIMSEQGALQGAGGTVQLPISATLKPKVHLPARNLTLSELQRLKRQFVTVHKKAITLGTTEKGHVDWDEDRIAEKFVVYLEEHLKD